MGAKEQTERENQDLIAAGFESMDDEYDLWRSQDGVWFGRNAALQSARQRLRPSTGRDVAEEGIL